MFWLGDFHYFVFHITYLVFFFFHQLICSWFPLCIFSSQFIVFFSSDWFSFTFSIFLFFLCISILLSSVSILWSLLETLSDRLLISIHLVLFSGVLSCTFVWNVFLCLLFCLSLCVYILSRSAMSIVLRVPLCRGVLWGPVTQLSWLHWYVGQTPSSAECGVQLWLLLMHWCSM